MMPSVKMSWIYGNEIVVQDLSHKGEYDLSMESPPFLYFLPGIAGPMSRPTLCPCSGSCWLATRPASHLHPQ
jgi:hypothetical protein